ncbi:mitochondrial uncoupling protein 2-like [Ctenocephalides felis]|uniref:mitochondrial uncoupling protein 2-like n=1 Tax=Ctenocephalides felis TaxID=7515 RepID=UPI000E6E3FB2|nr:mitochondrial uncoupling protein 2-like [Ctenocephalides felis]
MVLADKDAGIVERLLTAGTSACIADFLSFPLDTAKVRLQVQGEVVPVARNIMLDASGQAVVAEAPGLRYKGVIGTMGTIARQEGFKALYNGLSAGLQRQMCFSSVRLGLYDSVKDFYTKLLYDTKDVSMQLGARILAGATTGSMCVLFAQPTDVVKVRYQAQIRNPGVGARYKSTPHAYKSIFKEEGLRGLWRGTAPNVCRNGIVNISEIVCYDLVKDLLMQHLHMKDGVPCHFTSAVIAGFCTTVVASPVDVIKTRYMNAPKGQYNGAIDCTVRLLRSEGASAFYKGFVPSFMRLVSWNICMWITYEQVKIAVKGVVRGHD